MSVSYRAQTARVTGARHVRAGEMCQDAALCGVRGELAFYGLADGQSGARFGLEGAQAALTVIRDYIGRRGLTLLASYVYTDEIQYELAQLLRRELRRLSRLRGAAETDFGSTAVVFAVCRRTGRYMTVHLGDGAILGVKGLSRVDFFVRKVGAREEVIFNEINTLPGFTEISMYPKLFMNDGMTYSEIIDRLVDLALGKEL